MHFFLIDIQFLKSRKLTDKLFILMKACRLCYFLQNKSYTDYVALCSVPLISITIFSSANSIVIDTLSFIQFLKSHETAIRIQFAENWQGIPNTGDCRLEKFSARHEYYPLLLLHCIISKVNPTLVLDYAK